MKLAVRLPTSVLWAATCFSSSSCYSVEAFGPSWSRSTCIQQHTTTSTTTTRIAAVQEEDEGIVLGKKYLLDDHHDTSTSGKSTLVEASSHHTNNSSGTTASQTGSTAHYGSDGAETRATDARVLVKFSDNIKALKREARIYDKVAAPHPDLFVTIHDFYTPTETEKNGSRAVVNRQEQAKQQQQQQSSGGGSQVAPGSQAVAPGSQAVHADSQAVAAGEKTYFDTKTQSLQPISKAANTQVKADGKVTFKGQAALVMEMGTQDLKSFIRENGPMKGDVLRDSVVQTARTLKAFHAKKKVWTELKSANFVMVPQGGGGKVLKAIDLESAVPKGQPPIDFSPEAIPPEFAQAYLDMTEHKMEMQKSFDIFSLGLLWYEMATGQQYWQREFFQDQQECDDAEKIALGMRWRDEICLEHAADKIEQPLRDLLAQCLRVKAEERPTIDEILAHPYIAEKL